MLQEIAEVCTAAPALSVESVPCSRIIAKLGLVDHDADNWVAFYATECLVSPALLVVMLHTRLYARAIKRQWMFL